MADQDTSWTWNFSGPTTMSKAHSRAILPKEVAWDLVGFDGNETGSLRTHPGFKRLAGDGGTFTPTTGGAGMGKVRGFWPVTVITSSSSYLYGYVWAEYTLVSSTTHTITFYGKFHNGTDWVSPQVANTTHKVLELEATTDGSDTTEIDVQSSGRFLYFFARGYKPEMATFATSGSPLRWSVSFSDVGPGNPPKAISAATETDANAITIATVDVGGTGEYDLVVFGDNDNSVTTGIGPTAPTREEGNYTFAVQYINTDTGRKSPISNTTTLNVTSTHNHVKFRVGRFRGLYNRALIYRTVNLGAGVGGTTFYGSGTLHLEKVIDITTTPSPAVSLDGPDVYYSCGTASTDIGCDTDATAIIRTMAISLTDSQLVYQDVFIDKTRADSVGPKGGVAQFLSNVLFVSRLKDSNFAGSVASSETPITPEYPPRSLGDLRWSATNELVADNFTPFNRWVPKTPGNEIIGMRQVGNFMIGFSSDRIYRIGRQNNFVRVEEGHIGYGLIGPNALESVGTTVYFVSGGGLKAVSMDGAIEDVTGLDNLVNVTWASAKSSIQMAYDARGQCLTIYKPATGALTATTGSADGYAAILWFGTNRMTQLVDLPFRYVKTGNVHSGAYLERRAIFVKRDSLTTFGVYIVDHERSNANKNLCGGTARNPQVSGSTPSPAVDTTEFDCNAYTFTSVSGSSESISTNNSWVQNYSWSAVANTYASLAPIVQRWVGGNLGVQFQPGTPEFKDFFRQKQVSSVAPYYEVVGTESLPTYGTWWGLLYRGAEESVYISSRPLGRDGSVQNITAGVGVAASNAPFRTHGAVWSSLSPGFQCNIAGADLRLLAFSVTGRILDTDRRFT